MGQSIHCLTNTSSGKGRNGQTWTRMQMWTQISTHMRMDYNVHVPIYDVAEGSER